MRKAAIVFTAAVVVLVLATPADAIGQYQDAECTFDWATNTVTCKYHGQSYEEFCTQHPAHEICFLGSGQSVSQSNGVTESDSESDDRPSGAVDEGEQPLADEPELTEDIEEAERNFTECVAANTRLVDTS